MPIVLGIFLLSCLPQTAHCPLPDFLIGRIGYGPVSVSALSQHLTLDQGGDMAALFSVPPPNIWR